MDALADAGEFADFSSQQEASQSYAHDSTNGHIFPESHHSQLGISSRASDTAHTSSSNRDSSSSLAFPPSYLSNPKSHPIQVTGDDIEHSLSELDLGQLTPAGDDIAATSRQASQSSMLTHQIPYAGQQPARGSRRGSRNASFTGVTGSKQGKAGHRRSSSGEEPTAATSHFKLSAKQLHGSHVMQEPPLSTRSSYRMDSWDHEPQSSGRSYGPPGTLPRPLPHHDAECT